VGDTKVADAISRLAALYDYGELLAESYPSRFLAVVARDVAELRSDNARLHEQVRGLREVLAQIHGHAAAPPLLAPSPAPRVRLASILAVVDAALEATKED